MEKVKSVLGTAIEWVKTHVKVVAIIAVVIVVALLVLGFLTGGPKRAVKSYISAMNKANDKKILKTMDVKGVIAWSRCGGKASKFLDEYEDIEDDEVDEYKETLESTCEKMCDSLKDYDKYSIKIKQIKEVEKEDKGLYKVKAKVEVKYKDDDDESESTDTMTFYVYKGKIVSGGMSGIY